MIEFIHMYGIWIMGYLTVGTLFASVTSEPDNLITGLFKTFAWPWVIAISILYAIKDHRKNK